MNRAKREKTLPDVLGKDEIKRILDVAAKDLRFFCIFSILYSAGLRISELLELKPGDINESRNLIRVRQGKGTGLNHGSSSAGRANPLRKASCRNG